MKFKPLSRNPLGSVSALTALVPTSIITIANLLVGKGKMILCPSATHALDWCPQVLAGLNPYWVEAEV